jgi:hypothetical protein
MMGSRAKRAFAIVISGCVAVAVPALAGAHGDSARGIGAEILGSSQGQTYEAGKVRVRVDATKPGTAKVKVMATGAGEPKQISERRATSIPSGGKTVAVALTKGGRSTLAKCSVTGLKAKVAFKSGRGDPVRIAARTELDPDIATCSTGSEDPTERPYLGPKIPTPNADRCDFLDTSVCLYPFPNDYYTVDDASSDTGKRIDFDAASMPKNANGVPIDPTDYNRADGFSPGQPIVIKIPGLENQDEFDANGLVPVNDVAAYADADQKVVVINADTGERQPIFAEVDANAAEDADRVLYIRPAVNFDEGGHYIVALRDLVGPNGKPLQPGLAFRAYRDRLLTDKSVLESRRGHMEDLFSTLQGAGIERAGLYAAWDFTVASADNIAGRVLAMRDDAFAKLGDTNLSDLTVQGSSPTFDVPDDGVTNFAPCSAGADPNVCETGEDDRILRQVRGTVTVPCYLNQDGCPPGSQFAYDGPNDLTPNFNSSYTMDAPFTCVIPRSVEAGGTVHPARPSLYGHGLLGSREEVTNGSGGNIKQLANDHNFVFCAVNWAGFAEEDQFEGVLHSLTNMSNFPQVADRVQQGFINFLYLGRAMIHSSGFGSDPAFEVDPDGPGGNAPQSVIGGTRLFYDGNSQGGILGGALTALAPDFNRAALGVPGMNYSTLLQRSSDFIDYSPVLYGSYPSELERPLVFSLVQMLWDRAEADGFAEHMTTDPYPNTPPHQVLMHVAYGDHQVANITAEIEARTIGARAYQPALDPGRHWDANPLWGIAPIGSFPYAGSAFVYWDGGPAGFDGTINFGTDSPPNENVPPPEIDGVQEDPHSYPRRDLQAQQQKSDFLQVNGFIGPCADDGPCYSNGYTGAP